MIEDREVWACADLLLRQHGARAVKVAEARAQVLRSQGTVEGARIYRLIARRIRTLEARRPQGLRH